MLVPDSLGVFGVMDVNHSSFKMQSTRVSNQKECGLFGWVGGGEKICVDGFWGTLEGH